MELLSEGLHGNDLELRTAVGVRTADAARPPAHVVFHSFGLARMALMVARAVEDSGLFPCHLLARRDENELAGIGRLGIELEGLVAHCHARAALQRVAVVVHDLFPRA